MNMLRVWGGGVYERDIFYDLCDEYGILVWQDFMFANTIYPNDKKLLDNIALEVAEQVNRLNKHACLALWCGNNEIKVAMTHWGWPVQYDYKEKEYFEFYSNYHFIFNRLLPSIIAKQKAEFPTFQHPPKAIGARQKTLTTAACTIGACGMAMMTSVVSIKM
jgi:beta-mannosidase